MRLKAFEPGGAVRDGRLIRSLWREYDEGEVEAAKELYLKHGPGNLWLIVRSMIESGYKKFRQKDLVERPERMWPGLVKFYGLQRRYEELHREESTAEPANSAQVETEVAEETVVDAAPKPSESFQEWLAQTWPRMTWTWNFQSSVIKELLKMKDGKLMRLMIFMPPRHGKSELVTIRFAAWRLVKEPTLRIVIASYNQRLANKFSRRIRRIYQGLADAGEAESRMLNTADEWETAEGGSVKAVGVGAGITGFGGDLIIIDDPIKGRADAESDNSRERVWDWYTDDLHTRLEPNGQIILIQTRWHEDDLAGRLLKAAVQDLGDKWKVIKLPAIAMKDDPLKRKIGTPLCKERFPLRELEKKRVQMGSYKFNALYQQEPMSAESCLFKRDWFKRIVDRTPNGLTWVRAYDLAVSTKTTADYTASFRCAIDQATGDLYIADGFRKRIEFPEQRRYIKERIAEEKDTRHCIEAALHGQAFVQELQREVRFAGRGIQAVKPDADKTSRALSWQPRAEAGKVVLVRGAWIDEFLDEVCRFPHGKHDDQVDAVSLAVQMIARAGGKGAAGF